MAIVSLFRRTAGGDSGQFLDIVRASRARKADAELRLRYYRDDQVDDLLSLIRARWADPTDFRLFCVNIVRKIVDKLAAVYAGKPFRDFPGWSPAKGEALYAEIGADVVLKKANRLAKLHKTVMLQVGYADDRPTLSVVTPNILDVFHDGDPERPTRVIVTHPGAKAELTEYSDWTAESYTRRNHLGHPVAVAGNPDGVNPYGVLPFVPVFDYAPDDVFFLPGGADLIEAQRAVNVALANLWRAIEWQSHGQAWVSGFPADRSLEAINGPLLGFGPSVAVKVPAEGKFGFATPGTPIEEILRAIEFLIKQTAVANHLAANVFELSPKAESGAAKLAESRDLLEARKDDLDLWRGYEARLFDVLRAVVNAHAPLTVPAGASVRVDFAEITEPIDEVQRLESYQRRLDMGVWSPVDVLMADDPDVRDREEAKRILQERREEAALLGLGFAGPRIPQEVTP